MKTPQLRNPFLFVPSVSPSTPSCGPSPTRSQLQILKAGTNTPSISSTLSLATSFQPPQLCLPNRGLNMPRSCYANHTVSIIILLISNYPPGHTCTCASLISAQCRSASFMLPPAHSLPYLHFSHPTTCSPSSCPQTHITRNVLWNDSFHNSPCRRSQEKLPLQNHTLFHRRRSMSIPFCPCSPQPLLIFLPC